jgi:hypothetical protein
VDFAAEAVRSLQHGAGHLGVVVDFFLDAVCRRQPGNAAANDDHFLHAGIMTGLKVGIKPTKGRN